MRMTFVGQSSMSPARRASMARYAADLDTPSRDAASGTVTVPRLAPVCSSIWDATITVRLPPLSQRVW
jgi:hypothetical protein